MFFDDSWAWAAGKYQGASTITWQRGSLVRAKLCDWLFLTSVVYPPFLPLVDYLPASEAFPGRRMSDNEAEAGHNEVRRGGARGVWGRARRGQEGLALASPGLPGAAGFPWGYLRAGTGTVCALARGRPSGCGGWGRDRSRHAGAGAAIAGLLLAGCSRVRRWGCPGAMWVCHLALRPPSSVGAAMWRDGEVCMAPAAPGQVSLRGAPQHLATRAARRQSSWGSTFCWGVVIGVLHEGQGSKPASQHHGTATHPGPKRRHIHTLGCGRLAHQASQCHYSILRRIIACML